MKVKMFCLPLPIEEREENLDRAVEITRSMANAVGGPIYANFMNTPLVALPGQRDEHTRDNWRKLFAQFQANPEPASAKKWHEKPIVVIPVFLITALLAVFGFDAIFTGIDAIHADHRTAQVVNYDKRDASITIDIDAWKRGMGCAEHDYLEMESKAVGSEHGNRLVKLSPYCVGPGSGITPPLAQPSTEEAQ